MLIQCYSPGKCHNYIPGLSRFSRRCTNPQNIFVIVYHRSDRKGEKGWGHLHQATTTAKLYSGTVKIRRLEGGLGLMRYSRYIGVILLFHATGMMGRVKSANQIKSANQDPLASLHEGF